MKAPYVVRNIPRPDPAVASEPQSHLLHGVLDLRNGLRVEAPGHLDVDHGLRETRHAGRELGEALPGLAHHGQDLERRHQGVSRRGLVQQQDVSRSLAADFAARQACRVEKSTAKHQQFEIVW